MTFDEAVKVLEKQQALAAAIGRSGNDAGASSWRDVATAISVVIAQAMRAAA
jgi:hypothetical protein